jgi:hypothetical protein
VKSLLLPSQWFGFVAAALACGCGGSTARALGPDASSDAGGGDGEVTDGGSSGGPADGAMQSGLCPPDEPADGAPCPALNLACGFGDSPRPECRHLWSCTNQGWREAQGSCADLTSFCPAAQPDGSVCTPINDPSQNGYCAYAGDVLCLCPCVGTRACGPGNWVCHSPPTTDGCPATAPNLGSACSAQGLQCSYGDPCDGYGTDLYCRAGTWQHGFVACTTR